MNLAEQFDIDFQLRASDSDMARVVEDLIAMLDRRGLINADDLPEPAEAKLERRAELRRKMRERREGKKP